MSTKALASPPTKRSSRKSVKLCVRPMPPVVIALRASAPISQKRRGPGRIGAAAASAPTK
jgi:hypothetical protein